MIEVKVIGLEMAVFLPKIWRELSKEDVRIVKISDSKTLERAIGSTVGVNNRRSCSTGGSGEGGMD